MRRHWTTAMMMCVLPALSMCALPLSSIAQTSPDGRLDACLQQTIEKDRLACLSRLVKELEQTNRPAITTPEGWMRLESKATNPARTRASLFRSAELVGSDPDFIGISLQCVDTGIELLLPFARAFVFQEKPTVDISTDLNLGSWTATVVPPGSVLRLPSEALSVLLARPTSSKVTLIARGGDWTSRAIVRLDGLAAAHALAQQLCK